MAKRPYGNGSIEARGKNSWRVTYYRGRDPLTGELDRVRFTVRGTRREADKALREALSKHDQGIDVVPDKITVGEWLTRWLEQHTATRGIAETTRSRYEYSIRRQLIPALGRLRLQELRRHHVEAFYADPSHTPNTKQKARVVLRASLAQAVRSGLIPSNPAEAVRPPAVRKAERRSLTEAEVGNLFAAVSGTAYDVPVRLTIATGLRQGELLALTWEDFDLQRRTLSIRRNLQWVKGKPRFSEPKTRNSRRTLELSPVVADLLVRHRTQQLEHRLSLGPRWNDRDLIFPSAVGTVWEPNNLYRGYKPLVAAAGISNAESVTWHTLRHTATTLWINAGADIHTVSRRLGHASAAFTMDNYGHLLVGQQEHVAHALDHLVAL